MSGGIYTLDGVLWKLVLCLEAFCKRGSLSDEDIKSDVASGVQIVSPSKTVLIRMRQGFCGSLSRLFEQVSVFISVLSLLNEESGERREHFDR